MCCEDFEDKSGTNSFVERVYGKKETGLTLSRRGFVKRLAILPVAGALLTPLVNSHIAEAQPTCQYQANIVPTWRVFSMEVGTQGILKYRQMPLRPDIQHIPMALSEVSCNQVEFTLKAEYSSGIVIKQVEWSKQAFFRDPQRYDLIERDGFGNYRPLMNASGCLLPYRVTVVSPQVPRVEQQAFYADANRNIVPDSEVKERIGQDGTIYCRYRGHFATFSEAPEPYRGNSTYALPFCTAGIHILYAKITLQCAGKDQVVTAFQGVDVQPK